MIFDGVLAYPNQTELLLEPLARIIHECRRKRLRPKPREKYQVKG
jgi:hypothetical protein